MIYRNTKGWLALAASLLLGAPTLTAAASEMCVANTTQLNAALSLAQFGPMTIRLVQGTYDLDATPWAQAASISAGSSLLGGYTANCAGRNIAAGNTVLTNSGGSGFAGTYVRGNLTLEGLTFRGIDFALAANADIGSEVAPSTRILIRRSAFIGGARLDATWWQSEDIGGTIRIVDTLMVGGGEGSSGCSNSRYSLLLEVWEGAPSIELVNNTVLNSPGMGVCLINHPFDGFDGHATLWAYNNIFWNAGADDLRSDSNALVLVDNTIGHGSFPSPFVPAIGTLSGNPGLDADYRPLEPNSPSIDSGTEDVRGGLPANDLDGGPRVVGLAVDRGAYESNLDNAFIQTVTNVNDSGAGSLRQAIINENANGTGGIITFAIGSACGPHVIALNSPLPTIAAPVIINGFSQPGASANDLDVGNDAAVCVVLEGGDSAGAGLRVASNAPPNTQLTIAGLAFGGFTDAAVDFAGTASHAISGSHFGGSVGSHALTSNHIDIRIGEGVHDVTIGGPDPAQRNIVGGASAAGIVLLGEINGALQSAAHDNQIVNNAIGVGWSGGADGGYTNRGNGGDGILLKGYANRVEGNTIGDNASHGIEIDGGAAHDNTVQDNAIGSGSGSAFGNLGDGVHVVNAARDNTIATNTIAHNQLAGVRIVSGLHNRISKNAIALNGALGIDLAGEGVTPNDNDAGFMLPDYANRGQNFPVLTQATGGAQSGIVAGTLTTTPGVYAVQLFVSNACDSSGYGEGAIWRKTFNVSVPSGVGGQGTATFSTAIKPGDAGTLAGKRITATATDASGDTSEFSACIAYANDAIFADGFDPPK